MNETNLFRIYSYADKSFHYFTKGFPCNITGYISDMMHNTCKVDANGRQVYTGDIVKYYPLPPFEVSTGILGEVVISKDGYYTCIVNRTGKGGGYETRFDDDDIEYFEIVGNVFENPELLPNFL